MTDSRIETDSLGEVPVPVDALWGAQTQRALEHFRIGQELMPREMVLAYAVVKRAASTTNHAAGQLSDEQSELIVAVCDEILAGRHLDMFPLPVWVSGSGTQLNMNVNEVIANRICQMVGTPLGSKTPVHPNDHVNLCQSSNDTFPSAMCISAATAVTDRLVPAVQGLGEAFAAGARRWADVVKIGRTHLQDATPLTLGQEWSGYAAVLDDGLGRVELALGGLRRLALGGTAVGTGVNASPGFAESVTAEVARLTGQPFVTAPNTFAVQGAHDDLVHLSGTLRTLAGSLIKIADDLRLLGSGPRAGLGELVLPANEPGSSIMPGKVNPTQVEALTMVGLQVMANDVAVGLGGAGGHLEMNAYKPLIIRNLLQSITLLADACVSFRVHLVEGVRPDRRRIAEHVQRSLMLVTALVPAIGYDSASRVAHHAMQHDLTLRAAALELGVVSEGDFDRLVDPRRMLGPGATS
ncbi:MAG TPA: class II fumarate hydratase [Motilibacterales bacterium]|nr:class II fumarate hydratase [Motilibacterales bacterium]